MVRTHNMRHTTKHAQSAGTYTMRCKLCNAWPQQNRVADTSANDPALHSLHSAKQRTKKNKDADTFRKEG